MNDRLPIRRIPAAEAADRLGIDRSRIRALASSGQLRAEKVANRWWLDVGDVERRVAHGPEVGRPVEPRRAWALLFLLSGEDAPWVSGVERSKLRAVARDRSINELLPRLRRRAEVRYLAAGDRARLEIGSAPDFVRSGVSAAEHHGVSLRSSRVLDGYIRRDSAKRLIYRHALRDVEEGAADAILRVVDYWPFKHQKFAPAAAVAADLVDSLDERAVRAGRELSRRLAIP
jgi:hypothetical protein